MESHSVTADLHDITIIMHILFEPKKKSCTRRKQLTIFSIILLYELKSASLSGYSLLSTFALISLKAFTVNSTSSSV